MNQKIKTVSYDIPPEEIAKFMVKSHELQSFFHCMEVAINEVERDNWRIKWVNANTAFMIELETIFLRYGNKKDLEGTISKVSPVVDFLINKLIISFVEEEHGTGVSQGERV